MCVFAHVCFSVYLGLRQQCQGRIDKTFPRCFDDGVRGCLKNVTDKTRGQSPQLIVWPIGDLHVNVAFGESVDRRG